MIKTWRVQLEVARDDDGSLDDEVVRSLTEALAGGTTVTRGENGAVIVELPVQARTDRDAMTAAERSLREAADRIWASSSLPPFTITSMRVTESPAGG
jgi:hypothetical protein